MGTKITAPRLRSTGIARKTLVGRLRSHGGPVLVVAPPGFGKTTLLLQWQQAVDEPFAWLSLDEADNDPVLFWRYVIAAIQAVEPRLELVVPSPVPAPGVVVDTIVPRLLNELDALGAEVVLVLDDYHLITSAACHESVELFLAREPTNVRLVVSARTDPPLPVGRLRATGDLLELRAADLSFSEPETARFLNHALDLGLSDHSIAELHDRTEGWPAGLYLAYLTLRDATDRAAVVATFGGSTRHVGDYLAEVALDRLDPETREFLLETSVLERMCGALCDATTARTGSAERLVDLEHANLFLIPLDDRREWYRYHHLFADLLQNELGRRAPDRAAELHRRAFEWLSDAGFTGAAIHHALAAGESDTAGRLVAEQYLPTIEWGGYATVASWLAAFPRRVVASDARLSVVEAWVMSFLLRRDEARLALDNALTSGYEGPLPDGASSVEASAALLRAGFPWGDVGGMLSAARRAFELEGQRDSLWRVTAHVQLGWALSLAGQFDEARPFLERGAALAPRTDQWLNAVGASCLLAWLALETGDLEEAPRRARAAVAAVEAHGLSDSPVAGYASATLGAVRARLEDLGEADRLLRQGLERMRTGTDPLLLVQVLLASVPVRRALGSADDARALLDEATDLIERCADPGIWRARHEQLVRSTVGSGMVVGEGELTARELEVLRLLGTRLSQRDIGRELFVSYNTVHTHLRSIYRKLGVSSRADAVTRAREYGLVARAARSPG